jgi:putative transposase
MRSAGDCYNHALADSFFVTLECEALDQRKYRTREEAGRAVFGFIERRYNPNRRHFLIGQTAQQRNSLSWVCIVPMVDQ